MVFDVMRVMSTQIRRQDSRKTLADRFASCENTEVAPPPPPICLANEKFPTHRHCVRYEYFHPWKEPFSDVFALFQACVGNFDTIAPWKVDGTLS